MSDISPRIILLCRLLLAVALIIFTYLLLNKPSGNVHGLINDKLAHGIGFWILIAVTDLAFPKVGFIWKAVALSAYGLIIEFIQLQTGYRHFSWWDWLADIAGVLAFLPVRSLVRRLLARLFPA